jgi:hypothetical protein
MEMILLDWTRMGRTYCLAGVVAEAGGCRVVRPLPSRQRHSPQRNVGWSPFLLQGHCRWEIFELVKPEPASGQRPHVEDYWVVSLRPRRKLAEVSLRRNILQRTLACPGESLFGDPLTLTRAGAYLQPGNGQRSLTTVLLPSKDIFFAGSWRIGALGSDIRVSLPLPDIGERQLAVKDYFLLQQAGQGGTTLQAQLDLLNAAIRRLGEQVAVRIGLSRAFPAGDGEQGVCWLMADGFFSPSEPQP